MKKILVVIMVTLFCFTPLAGCAHNNMDNGKYDIYKKCKFLA